MQEKELKTSPAQRIIIIVIAVLMLGSIIASYAAIVISGNNKSNSTSGADSNVDEAKVAELQEAYENKVAEFAEASKEDFNTFVKYKSEVKAYNEAAANEGGVIKKDLKEGTGSSVSEDNYLAYYIGFCADESVFDSSFDDPSNPTEFTRALDPSVGLIEGWKLGVDGMKIGGVREITIPQELAYGETQEICGGTSKPLKFIVMAVPKSDALVKLNSELEEAYLRYQYALYGMDYDDVAGAEE
ncbi:FKBP-type peptidyl-prolyl cis-trans isomerase [Candidatus Saccharibacteria bacterium]|nr:FKBP-type peptidyl-prolyl cis-trans isomerase [Candidatus Saccharibacteria bacterium]